MVWHLYTTLLISSFAVLSTHASADDVELGNAPDDVVRVVDPSSGNFELEGIAATPSEGELELAPGEEANGPVVQEVEEVDMRCCPFMLFNARHTGRSFRDTCRSNKQAEQQKEEEKEEKGHAGAETLKSAEMPKEENVKGPIDNTKDDLTMGDPMSYDALFSLIVDGSMAHEHIKEYEDSFRQHLKDAEAKTPLEQKQQEPQAPVEVPQEEINEEVKEEQEEEVQGEQEEEVQGEQEEEVQGEQEEEVQGEQEEEVQGEQEEEVQGEQEEEVQGEQEEEVQEEEVKVEEEEDVQQKEVYPEKEWIIKHDNTREEKAPIEGKGTFLMRRGGEESGRWKELEEEGRKILKEKHLLKEKFLLKVK